MAKYNGGGPSCYAQRREPPVWAQEPQQPRGGWPMPKLDAEGEQFVADIMKGGENYARHMKAARAAAQAAA